MANKQMLTTWISTIIIFTLFMVGCQKPVAEEPTIVPQDEDVQTNEPIITDKDLTSSKEDNEPDKAENDAYISSDNEQEQEDNNTDEAVDGKDNPNKGTSDDKKPAVKSNYDIAVPYSPNKPTLMGLTINQPKNVVVTKFGNPREEYVMEDESDPITVYEYPGFAVGFNKLNLLVFIDVVSSQMNPGLNGLRLGDTVKEAVQALGKPSTNTEYVLNYKSEGVILKLDIDPNTDQINSIKLFGGQ